MDLFDFAFKNVQEIVADYSKSAISVNDQDKASKLVSRFVMYDTKVYKALGSYNTYEISYSTSKDSEFNWNCFRN
jgi:hypothetical protein